MNVVNRFSDIINSNINAILDQAEDPKKMINHITREMQATLVDVRAASARYISDKKKIQEQIDSAKRHALSWDRKAALAISKDRDDLAKAALAERLRHDNIVSALEQEYTQVGDSLSKLKRDADELEQKLSLAKARQKALILRGQTVKSRLKVKRQLHDVSCEIALARFEAYERKLDDLEGEVESYELSGSSSLSNKNLEQEINALQDDQHLTKELEELKARLIPQNAPKIAVPTSSQKPSTEHQPVTITV